MQAASSGDVGACGAGQRCGATQSQRLVRRRRQDVRQRTRLETSVHFHIKNACCKQRYAHLMLRNAALQHPCNVSPTVHRRPKAPNAPQLLSLSIILQRIRGPLGRPTRPPPGPRCGAPDSYPGPYGSSLPTHGEFAAMLDEPCCLPPPLPALP